MSNKLMNSYPCRFRALLRICHAEGLNVKEAIAKAKLNLDDERRLRTWQTVPVEKYEKLAEILNCEPTSLYYAPEYPQIHDVPTLAFVRRVEELLDDGVVPVFYEGTKNPVDVVEYLWQSDDPVLNSLSLSFQQERDAYLLLRDESQRLIERPIHIGPRRNQIGKFHIATVWHEDIVADIRVREALANTAYDTLQEQYKSQKFFHIELIKQDLPRRLAYYRECVCEDEINDSYDNLSCFS